MRLATLTLTFDCLLTIRCLMAHAYSRFCSHDDQDSRPRYMVTHPLRAGGQFPPPHTSIFVDGISSLEPCTWGILLDEAAWIWDKYDVTSPRAGRGEYGSIGQIQRTRSVSPCPSTCSCFACAAVSASSLNGHFWCVRCQHAEP